VKVLKEKEKIKFILTTLEGLYPEPEIPLDHENNFTFLVAVMLSAQSTDKKVNEITPSLFKIANTAEKMIGVKTEEIQRLIKQIGLAPTKSKNIKKMSYQLLEKHNGNVPNNFEDLENLAGVGHKTASVIMSQVFNQPAFPVDTHIHRLAKRWGLSDGKSVTKTEKDLKKIFDKSLWNKLHLQIIFYGREYCQARKAPCNCRICEKTR
tara:strand:- start:4810 stop:5433 length:624 start_codon:yes stop_codon:yes gene_type:complete